MKEPAVVPVIRSASYFLGHVPGLVFQGSKPSREIAKNPALLDQFRSHLRTFDQAVSYAPNQVFIGNMGPDDLFQIPNPWFKHPVPNASRWGSFGEMMPEEEFLGMMKICDEFELLLLEENFHKEAARRLRDHPRVRVEEIEKLGKGIPREEIEKKLKQGRALPLFARGRKLVGCLQKTHEEDASLAPEILAENLAARASGVMALRHLTHENEVAGEIDYLLGCGEEAVGDRYNRGGGNMAKAIGEMCGCSRATGSDVKAFCCAPVHAIVLGAGLIGSGLFRNVVVVAGGSLAKLGMKFQGHFRHNMPVIEDVLAGIAVWLSGDDGKSPVIRLDSVGKHEISSGSSQQAILQKLVIEPLDRMNMKLTQIAKYATEMHNPEATEPQGSGNVPKTNYRTIGSFAVLRKEIDRNDLDQFVETHGMPGFSPTQGHIASAVPVLGHAIRQMREGKIQNTMFLAKGSLFLGRMTQLSDGISFVLEKNKGGGLENGVKG